MFSVLSLTFLVSSYWSFSFVITVSIKEKNNSTEVSCGCLFLEKCIDQLIEDTNKVFNLLNCVFPLAVCSHIEHYLSLQIVALFTNYRVIRRQIHLP